MRAPAPGRRRCRPGAARAGCGRQSRQLPVRDALDRDPDHRRRAPFPVGLAGDPAAQGEPLEPRGRGGDQVERGTCLAARSHRAPCRWRRSSCSARSRPPASARWRTPARPGSCAPRRPPGRDPAVVASADDERQCGQLRRPASRLYLWARCASSGSVHDGMVAHRSPASIEASSMKQAPVGACGAGPGRERACRRESRGLHGDLLLRGCARSEAGAIPDGRPDGQLPIRVRTSNSSGKNVRSSARRRKSTPDEPPVPSLWPIVRCTTWRWRNRHSWKLSSMSTSSSHVS